MEDHVDFVIILPLLSNLLRKTIPLILLRIISSLHDVSAIDNCKSKPCQNGACVNYPGGFKCRCKPGYTGNLCQSGELPYALLLVLLLHIDVSFVPWKIYMNLDYLDVLKVFLKERFISFCFRKYLLYFIVYFDYYMRVHKVDHYPLILILINFHRIYIYKGT